MCITCHDKDVDLEGNFQMQSFLRMRKRKFRKSESLTEIWQSHRAFIHLKANERMRKSTWITTSLNYSTYINYWIPSFILQIFAECLVCAHVTEDVCKWNETDKELHICMEFSIPGVNKKFKSLIWLSIEGRYFNSSKSTMDVFEDVEQMLCA